MSITFLDGALGSILMQGGESVSLLNKTDPERVLRLHRQYIEAGSNIICSNTFSANRYNCSAGEVAEVVALGVALAKEAANGNAKVALDIGPLPELLDPYGDLEEEDCAEQYREILSAGTKNRPDFIFFETFMDIDMLEIAVKQATEYDIPLLCSMSFTEIKKTIMGHSVEQMCERLAQYNPTAIGLNCSMEPEKSIDVAAEFRRFTDLPIIFKPNAGKPQVSGQDVVYEDAAIFANECRPTIEFGEMFIGGCCGSSPEHIRLLKETLSSL